jgi:hypothetical protein
MQSAGLLTVRIDPESDVAAPDLLICFPAERFSGCSAIPVIQ